MAWAQVPSQWVRDGGLSQISWRSSKSDGTAALMLLIALSIRLNQSNMNRPDGVLRRQAVECTYDDLQRLTELSRPKVAAGIKLLSELAVIEVIKRGRNNAYVLPEVAQDGKWAQLPQTYLLQADEGLRGFSRFGLRHRNELNALKLYFVLLAYRNSRGNFTAIGYEKIGEISGLARNDVPQAVALLINHDLVHLSQAEPESGIGKPHNKYIVQGLGRV